MMQVVIYTSLNVIYDEKGRCVSKGCQAALLSFTDMTKEMFLFSLRMGR